jgi:hypothetical protein
MNRTTKTYKLHMQNIAAGEIRAMQERIDGQKMAAPAWSFDPDTARIFDIIVSLDTDATAVRVDVTVIEQDGPNTHTRILPNEPTTWAALVPMAARAQYPLIDRVGGAL